MTLVIVDDWNDLERFSARYIYIYIYIYIYATMSVNTSNLWILILTQHVDYISGQNGILTYVDTTIRDSEKTSPQVWIVGNQMDVNVGTDVTVGGGYPP